MNNDVPFECVPSALFNTYGIKTDNSCQYLPSVYHGGLAYVKTILNRNNASSQPQENKQINYINPYDDMIKHDEKMMKGYFYQYEYDTDYEFDVKSVDDIKNKRKRDEVLALYKSIDEYTEQKSIMDAKFKQYNKGNKKGYSPDEFFFL